MPIDRLLGKSHRGWPLVDITYQKHQARAVSRSALAQLLLRAALAAGARIEFNVNIERVESRAGLGVLSNATQSDEFDLIVIADGAASVLPEQAGLAVASTQYRWGALWAMFDVEDWPHARVLQQRFRTTRQMFGLMPTARCGDKLRLSLFWSLPCDAYQDWKVSSLEAWKDELIGLWPESAPVVCQIDSHDRLTFATYRHAWPRRLANPPICIARDAAHAMSPQLGLGATLAVQDALLLAQQVDALGPRDGPLAYSRKRLHCVRGYQALSRALTPCFQAHGSGWWRDALFALGLHVPGVPWLMYRSIAGPQRDSKSPALLTQSTE